MDWQGPTTAPGAYWGWGIAVLVIALTALGVAFNVIVLRKAGRNPFWSLLFLFPLAYLIGLWVFAFTRWPNADRGPEIEPMIGRHDDDPPPQIGPAPNARRSFSDRRR